MDQNSLCAEFSRAIAAEFDDAVTKIVHCIDQLGDEQLWWRPAPNMNSIANLVLHLCGNIRQWVVAGVQGLDDTRNRPWEFATRDGFTGSDLSRMLRELQADVHTVLANLTEPEMVRQRTIQGFECSSMQAILESVAHFRGHAQEIIHLCRIQLGDNYRFHFVPGPGQHGGGASQI